MSQQVAATHQRFAVAVAHLGGALRHHGDAVVSVGQFMSEVVMPPKACLGQRLTTHKDNALNLAPPGAVPGLCQAGWDAFKPLGTS